jgi:formate hydrogenlyase subunit 4
MSIGFIAVISVSVMLCIDVVLYYRAKQRDKKARNQEKRGPSFWQKYIAILLVNIVITITLSITIVIN